MDYEIQGLSGQNLFTMTFILSLLSLYDLTITGCDESNPKEEFQPSKRTSIITNIEKELNEKIDFQEDAISIFIKGLREFMNANNKSTIVSLIGPTGVGKTSLANIVKKHIPAATEMFKINQFRPYSHDSFPLIIIEDLTVNDLAKLVKFIDQYKEHQLMFVPVFNIQQTNINLEQNINYDFIEEINNILIKTNLPYRSAIFKQLNENHAKIWLKKLLEQQGATNVKIQCTIQSVLKEIDVENYGFKRIHSKLSVLNC